MNKYFLLALPFYIHFVILMGMVMLVLYTEMLLPQYSYVFYNFPWEHLFIITFLWAFLAISHFVDKLHPKLNL